ncbi:hypothetical protein LbFV_ORF103 [Leptopilina boulardi filamentous virus]|uniref:Uncharacterized protein n=1 Tax=Leptopilina boulardi filamentous virus TaxID=552509 RepID=A0A1S5YD42_9VIRU|nr:hypothetical protein LbFV_ORF103 [Leptopilina boulardi filamentous virus]AQQ80023.1 hypothetical protein LbFV_ORF103 [Leptopilina boulardi filamentous virus]
MDHFIDKIKILRKSKVIEDVIFLQILQSLLNNSIKIKNINNNNKKYINSAYHLFNYIVNINSKKFKYLKNNNILQYPHTRDLLPHKTTDIIKDVMYINNLNIKYMLYKRIVNLCKKEIKKNLNKTFFCMDPKIVHNSLDVNVDLYNLSLDILRSMCLGNRLQVLITRKQLRSSHLNFLFIEHIRRIVNGNQK